MYYKPDWAAARKRLEAFWAGEILDRCPVAVTAPRKPSGSGDVSARDPEENFERTWFGGEAVPAADWREVTPDIVERCAGRFFIGSPELEGAGDALLRTLGLNDLCAALLEQPEAVHRKIEARTDQWIQCHDEFYRTAREANGGAGVIASLGLWAPGRHGQVACDFSAVISPRTFREFFVPEIERESGWCDYATYHLDGPQAMKSHLDTLLAMEGIDTIQFSPGFDPASSPRYIPHYRKIQASGKRLYLPVQPEEIEPLLAALSPKGLFLSTRVDSQAEGEALLGKVSKWCAARNVFPVS